jgi:hypothetical protein
MRMPNLAGAVIIAFLTASALHLSVQPAAADDGSFCTRLAQIEANIEATMAPGFAKDLAIAAIYGTKKAAYCIQ